MEKRVAEAPKNQYEAQSTEIPFSSEKMFSVVSSDLPSSDFVEESDGNSYVLFYCRSN
ncbi:MAG: hypothetical protein HQM08_26530 [Candidatus Riflebacteria bacterium]|nr:hypothetical protein [Candidatus Riflebacteria bacterium]